MKYVFIVNPVSGKKDSSEIIKRISEYCLVNNIEFEIEITKFHKDAITLAKKHKRDNCVIFAVGGDGTLFETLNGVVGSKNKLGLIPCGSGNDFYKTVKDLIDVDMKMDVGKVNDTYFINVACIGIDAEVGANAEVMKEKGVKPNHIYNASIIYTFFKYRNKKIEIETKNTINANTFTMLSICNGRYYGGGYNIAPHADLTDGLFDVYIVKSIPKLIIPYLLLKLKKGRHEEEKMIEKIKIKSLGLKSRKILKCNVDGEIIEDNKFKFKVIKKGITFYQDSKLIDYCLGEHYEN